MPRPALSAASPQESEEDPESADETTPLVTSTASFLGNVPSPKEALVKTKEVVTDGVHWWAGFFQTYEPVDEGSLAEHPSALMLLGMHLGMALVQICSVLGAYAQLVSNAELIFPECGKHSVVDRLLGMHTHQGYLCEFTSQCLWIFPLVCCMMIPLFEYWDFCHSRLYYECLRVRMLLKFPDKDLLESPVFYVVLGLLCVGIATSAFRSGSQLANFIRALFPVMLPVFSFMTTMYVSWDLKYYLITLPNLTKDVEWSKKFFERCEHVTESMLEKAYIRKQNIGWDSDSSEGVFLELRAEALGFQASARHDPWQVHKSSFRKVLALVCGGRGWWVSDLLWLPRDMRASHFRFSFRLFATATVMLIAFFLYLIACTLLTYRVLAGRLEFSDIGPFSLLQNFIIDHANATARKLSFIIDCNITNVAAR